MSKKDMDRRKKFILELMGDPIYQPMRLREISSLLRLSKEEKRELYDVLDELCEEGKVSVDRKGRYEKVKGKWKKKKDDRYYDDRREEYGSEYGRKKKDKNKKEQPEGIQAEGTFIGHPKGFGFVEIEGQDEDIFIPESDTGTAMHQDKVRIIIRDDKKEGKRQDICTRCSDISQILLNFSFRILISGAVICDHRDYFITIFNSCCFFSRNEDIFGKFRIITDHKTEIPI